MLVANQEYKEALSQAGEFSSRNHPIMSLTQIEELLEELRAAMNMALGTELDGELPLISTRAPPLLSLNDRGKGE